MEITALGVAQVETEAAVIKVKMVEEAVLVQLQDLEAPPLPAVQEPLLTAPQQIQPEQLRQRLANKTKSV